jgi:hypothetical protein
VIFAAAFLWALGAFLQERKANQVWITAWRGCSPAILIGSSNPEDGAQLVPKGTYGCIFLQDGTYGRFIWRVVDDEKGAPFAAHMEHFYSKVGRWKP